MSSKIKVKVFTLCNKNISKLNMLRFDVVLVCHSLGHSVTGIAFLIFLLTLVMIRGKCPLVMIGGAQSAPLFLFVKTIEKVIRLSTVLKKKLIGSFKDKAIFHVILEIDR